LKIDHPSFFHPLCSPHADDGFLPDGEPSSLSKSVGNASVLPGELGAFLNDDMPPNNRSGLSSTADRHKTSPYTNDSTPLSKTKMASDPCKQSEAMIKISKLVELPIVCEALLQSPKLPLRAFPF
jgi:hypothetical protein